MPNPWWRSIRACLVSLSGNILPPSLIEVLSGEKELAESLEKEADEEEGIEVEESDLDNLFKGNRWLVAVIASPALSQLGREDGLSATEVVLVSFMS